MQRRIEAEVDEPAIISDGLEIVAFLACRGLGTDVDVHRAIVVILQLLTAASQGHILELGATIVVGATGVFAIQGHRPELLDRHILRHCHFIGLVGTQKIAFTVSLGSHVNLPGPYRRVHHPLGAVDRLIEPRGSFIQLNSRLGFLRYGKVIAFVPVSAIPPGLGVTRRNLDVARHQLTQRSPFEQDLFLPLRGIERLPFFYSQGFQHCRPGLVDFSHRLMIDNVCQGFPVGHATRGRSAPLHILVLDVIKRFQGFANSPHLEFRFESFHVLGIRIEDSQGDDQKVGNTLESVDAFFLVLTDIIFWPNDNKGAALGFLRTGLPDIRYRSLPNIHKPARCCTRRVIKHHRARFQVYVAKHVGNGQVPGNDTALFLERTQHNNIVL